ncbi:MAG: FecR family protein [Thermodesulfobacteriota bacterium]|nr:FecR family protein [Thermodesulfobacteriota bacterium]
MKHVCAVMCLLCVFRLEVARANELHIGSVKTLEGKVLILRQETKVNPVIGSRLFVKDTIKTGRNGSAGIILQDDTVFSLGPNSELAMNEFRFDPLKKDFSLVSRMIRGTFVFISGAIGKLSPESIVIETPDGTVAVRGTKFVAQIRN